MQHLQEHLAAENAAVPAVQEGGELVLVDRRRARKEVLPALEKAGASWDLESQHFRDTYLLQNAIIMVRQRPERREETPAAKPSSVFNAFAMTDAEDDEKGVLGILLALADN